MKIDKDGRIVLEFIPGVIDEIWVRFSTVQRGERIHHVRGVCEVSSYGRFRCDGVIIPQYNNKGYFMVSINIEQFGKLHQLTIGAHRIVAAAFIPNKENKPQVNHKYGRKRENEYWRLEWCTCRENNIHAIKHGLTPIVYGEDTSGAIYTNDQIHQVCKLICEGHRNKTIYKMLPFLKDSHEGFLSEIRHGSKWTIVSSQYDMRNSNIVDVSNTCPMMI